jgi:hypothetical protein
MDTRIVALFPDRIAGLEAIVAQIATGYSVVVRDVDADEYLDSARIYATEGAAVAYAQTLLRATADELEAAEAAANSTYDAWKNGY